MINQPLSDKELLQHKGFWHGMKTEHFLTALEADTLHARTMQRYWKNGERYFDDERELYEQSFYMKGWSMTRDKNYAFAWGDIVVLFDDEAIKRDFKVKPYSWASTIRNAQHLKQEREEFVIAELGNQTFDEIKNEYYDLLDTLYDKGKKEDILALKELCNDEGFIGYWRKPAHKTISFSNYVKGFFLRSDPLRSTVESFEELKSHPMFLGYFSKEKARENIKKSEPKFRFRFNNI